MARTSAEERPDRRMRWSSYARRLQTFRGGEPRITRAFRANQPALDFFPTTLWAQVAARRLRRVSRQLAGRRRGSGIPTAAPGCRGVSERVARGEVLGGPGSDHFRRAGSAGSRGASCSIPESRYGWRSQAIPERRSFSVRCGREFGACRWMQKDSTWNGAGEMGTATAGLRHARHTSSLSASP